MGHIRSYKIFSTQHRTEEKLTLPSHYINLISDRLNKLSKSTNIEHSQYKVNTIYFDSKDKKLYYQKLDGLSQRQKIRIRYYNDDPTFMKLEIKNKNQSAGWKDVAQFEFTKSYIENLTPHSLILELALKNKIEKISNKIISENLIPTSYVEFERVVYEKTKTQFRLTLDYSLKYSPLINRAFKKIAPTIIDTSSPFIAEFKYTKGKIPAWANKLKEELSNYKNSFSKYIRSIDSIKGQGINV